MVRQDDLGWSLLCNRVIVFDDTGEILPDGTVVAPDRPAPPPLGDVLLTGRVARATGLHAYAAA
jgi:hypothetical protein